MGWHTHSGALLLAKMDTMQDEKGHFTYEFAEKLRGTRAPFASPVPTSMPINFILIKSKSVTWQLDWLLYFEQAVIASFFG